MEHSGHTRFIDSKFLKPHTITELALVEMWAIYGTDVPLSVVVNIGPGLPNDVNVRQIARRFSSWGLNPAGASRKKRPRLLAIKQEPTLRSQENRISAPHSDEVEQDVEKPSIRFRKVADKPYSDHKHSIPRIDTVWSLSGRTMDEKLKRYEDEIERDIKKKLNNVNRAMETCTTGLRFPKLLKAPRRTIPLPRLWLTMPLWSIWICLQLTGQYMEWQSIFRRLSLLHDKSVQTQACILWTGVMQSNSPVFSQHFSLPCATNVHYSRCSLFAFVISPPGLDLPRIYTLRMTTTSRISPRYSVPLSRLFSGHGCVLALWKLHT